MTRPFLLKFANFKRTQNFKRGLFGSQSEISGLTLARKPRRKTQPGFSVNQSQSHQSYTTSFNTSMRAYAGVATSFSNYSAHFTTVVHARLSKG